MTITVETLRAAALAKTSYENYVVRLNKFQEFTGEGLEWIMLNPKEAITRLMKHLKKASTLSNYITPVCKLYTVNKDFSKKHTKEHQLWRKYLKFYKLEMEKIYKKTQYSKAQADKVVQWKEVEAEFCKTKTKFFDGKLTRREHMEFLLFSIFLNMNPKRADLGNIRIYEKGPVKNTISNYIVLAPKPILVLNAYKTSKFYGTLKENIPFDLLVLLKKSLELWPREHLFLNSRVDPEPYTKNDSYGKFVKRTFGKYFGREMGVGLWRIVYINANVNFQTDEYGDIEEGARLRGHSVLQEFFMYRKKNLPASDRRPDDERGKPIACS